MYVPVLTYILSVLYTYTPSHRLLLHTFIEYILRSTHIPYTHIGGAAKAAVIDPKYEKYFKMIKMMPEEVVRHKMAAENLSQTDIDEFFRQLLNSAVSGNTIATAVAPAAPVPVIDAKYAKYAKLHKMLGEGPVRQAMMKVSR